MCSFEENLPAYIGFPAGSDGKKKSACNAAEKIPWIKEWLPTLVFLPGEFHGQRSLTGYSLWGPKESDTTERLTLFSSLPAYL